MSYFDRFLSRVEGRGLEKQRVQLLAVTCTLLAAKFAEVKKAQPRNTLTLKPRPWPLAL